MNRSRSTTLMPALLAGVGWLSSCGDGTIEPPRPELPRATMLTVTPATTELNALGTTVQLTAEVRDQNSNAMAGFTVNWTVSCS